MGNNNDKKSARTLPDINFFSRDPLCDVTPEVWEAAKPKLSDKKLKMPIIFGTGGEIHSGKDFSEMWNNPEAYCFDKVFIPANTGHWNNPIEPLNYGEDISKKDLENIADVLSSRSKNPGFIDPAVKQIILDEVESKICIPDFPPAKRGSNYTKPKNRKKKK